MLSTPACSAKDRSVVLSTLRKRTPPKARCILRKWGSMRRQLLQNLCGHQIYAPSPRNEVAMPRRAALGGDKDHGVAVHRVGIRRHLVNDFDVVIPIAAVERFVDGLEAHGP